MSNFDQESKSPYYSIRVRVGNITSPKAWIGFMDRSIEITWGNQDVQTIRNAKDISEVVKERTMMDDLEKTWIGLDAWAKKHKLTFVDQAKKNEKGDPIA